MTLDGTTAGLWLVGLGSLLAAVPRLIRAPRPELGLSWESMARLVERIHVALETVGLVTVALGSTVLAVAELGPWWFEGAAVLLAIAAVYLVSAYKLRQLWLMRADTVQDDAAATSIPAAAEQRQLALDHARWRACVHHAFSRTPQWPPAPDLSATSTDKLVPRHIAELHESDTQLADLHIPDFIRADVYRIRAHGFEVRVVGDQVVATAPNGRTANIWRNPPDPKFGPVLSRQKFLEDLKELGLPISPGQKGQPHVDP
jgi:hypothetical protein